MESTSLMILPPTLLFANPVENSTKHTHVGLTPEEGTALCSEVTAWFLPPHPSYSLMHVIYVYKKLHCQAEWTR